MLELLERIEEQRVNELVNKALSLLAESSLYTKQLELNEDTSDEVIGEYITKQLNIAGEYVLLCSEIIGTPLLQIPSVLPDAEPGEHANPAIPFSEDEQLIAQPVGIVFACPATEKIVEEFQSNIAPLLKKIELGSEVKYPSYQDLLALLIERTKAGEEEDGEASDDYSLDELLDMYDDLYGTGVLEAYLED